MKHIFSLFIILFLINTNTAQSVNSSENSAADKEVLNGLDNIYNLKLDEAESRFKKLQKTNPNDIRGYFYVSQIYFYKALPTHDNVYYEKYMELSDLIIEKTEDLLDKNENDYDAMYYKGLSHSYTSLLMLSLNKNLLKAASNGNDGYRVLSGLIEKKPDYYDAYMGLGLYKIAIGFVPDKFQWLLSLIGFNGNIKEGRSLLKKSLEYGKYTKTDSKVFLSLFSLNEKEDGDRQSLDLSKELTEEYPESPVFKVFYSGILLQSGQTEESIKLSDQALEQNKYSMQTEIVKGANALLGTAYFRLNDYQKSIKHLEEYIKNANKEDRFNVYMFTLGVSYELSGDRQTAVQKYKAVRDNFINERDGELDKFFYRYAQNKIKNQLTDFEKKLIVAMNFRESLKPEEALILYNEMLPFITSSESVTDDDKIRYYFDLGTTYIYAGNPDKAIDCFNKCIKLNPEDEKWLVPHSYFELGKIYLRQNNKSKSAEMFETVYNYDDFDFESFLDMRMANYRNR
ncbi:MAG TPA: DUF3808 domain-containing protein [Ignavibacteria bacterium]|nr:DUF3808 domain-containing protein [Ignavibacteria bacterium]